MALRGSDAGAGGRTPLWVVVPAIALAYVLMARLGLWLALPPEFEAPSVWPPSGIALAAILIYGRRAWLGVWLGAFAANAWSALNPDPPIAGPMLVLAAAGVAAGSTVQAVVAATLIRRWGGAGSPLHGTASAFTYIGVILGASLIASSCGVVCLWLAGFFPAAAIPFVFRTWWLGDVAGALTVGSLLVAWVERPQLSRAQMSEGPLLAVAGVAVSAAVFGLLSSGPGPSPPLAYLTLPLLIGATLRYGARGGATALFAVNAVAIVATVNGKGPFAGGGLEHSLLMLQGFMCVTAVTILSMAGVLQERTSAEQRAQEWESVFRHAGWAVAVLDPAGTLRSVNPAFAAMHGMPPAAIVGRALADLVAPECRQPALPRFDDDLPCKPAEQIYETTHVRPDGRRVPVRVHVTTVRDAAGAVQYRAASFQDVSERKQAEATLRESEERYRLLTEVVPHMVWSAWPDLTLDFHNARSAAFSGKTVEQINAAGWAHDIHPDDLPATMQAIAGPMQRGEPFESEYRYRTAAGEYRWVVARGMPLEDDSGRVIKWMGCIDDVHDRRLAEQGVRESARRFSALAAAVPGFLFSNRPDGACDYVSPRFQEYTGLPVASALGDGWTRSIHPDDLPGVVAQHEACFAGTRTFERQIRFRGADGTYRWFLVRNLPVFDGRGAVTHWCGICTDIDEQKQAEARLRDLNAELEARVAERTRTLKVHEERFRSAFECAPIGLALVAPDGGFLQVNHALCGMLGYTEAELLAADFQAITHPDDLEADLDAVRKTLAGAIRTYQMEKRYFHKSGRIVHALLSVSLVRDAQHAPLYFVSQVKDDSARKRADAQTRASLREKDVLLAEIHHRVRNNLQIVSSLLDLQASHTADPRVIEMLAETRGRVRSMALIHDRLYGARDLARVDVRQYVRQLAEDLCQSYALEDGAVSLEVDVTVPPLPLDAAIPCGLLLNELLSNCLKHGFAGGRRGRVLVTFRREGEVDVLRVADDGVGLPSDLEIAGARTFGLQLVQTLVDQLQGRIDARTDGGAVFTVTLPPRTVEGLDVADAAVARV